MYIYIHIYGFRANMNLERERKRRERGLVQRGHARTRRVLRSAVVVWRYALDSGEDVYVYIRICRQTDI